MVFERAEECIGLWWKEEDMKGGRRREEEELGFHLGSTIYKA